jgi:transcriptional regulator of acetoin/glycerol metabolism
MAENQTPRLVRENPDLRAVLDRPVVAGDEVGLLREEIIASWERCVLAGLKPDRFDVPYEADVDNHGRLSWAAESVIDGVGNDLEGTRIGLLLTDQRGQVVDRRAGDLLTVSLLDRIQLAPGFVYGEEQIGTNAIGTAITRRGPAQVEGHEHFADALTRLACAAVPVTDPATARVIGVVDLTCAAEDASPLMLPLVKRAAWEIEQRLLADSSLDERILQEHFLRARRTSRGPVLALNQRTMLVNGAATGIVEPGDRELLWDTVQRGLVSGQPESSLLSLASGRSITIRSEPLLDGTRLVGALVRLGTATARTRGAPERGTSASTAAYGWSSLTATELAVAEQVAQGLTNREAAARLYLSPHTIDFHLRQVFRKLDVRSRVELTRVILQRPAGAPR